MNRKILLVEDNPSDEKLTLMAFKKNDFKEDIRVVRDGAEALEYLFPSDDTLPSDRRELPDLIILDLKLPKISGLEVLEKVRKHQKTSLLPVVVLTSSAEDKDLLQSYRLGVNSYVQKPVKFDEFVDAVRQLGSYWLFLNYNPPLPTFVRETLQNDES
jgi:two-component system, response regulator